jgi:hypothetical protein
MNQDDEKILILQNSFDQIKALMLDYANAGSLYRTSQEAEEAMRPVKDFFGLFRYLQEGDGIQIARFADMLYDAKVVDFDPPYNNQWRDSKSDEEVAMELDILFRGISHRLDDGLTNVLRI